MARFILHAGTPNIRELPLKEGVNTLGRTETNDCIVNDPSVSGRHCEVVVSPDSVRLRDLGSTNGTFINRAPVTEAILQSGQRIQLGSVELLFEGDGVPTNGSALSPPPRIAAILPPPGRIRIAGLDHAPAVALVESQTEAALPDLLPTPTPVFVSSSPCKYHPKTPARWLCTKCHKSFCDLCVTNRPAGGVEQKFCRSCGGVCTAMQVRVEVPEERSFFKELPRSFAYPFRGTGIMIAAAC